MRKFIQIVSIALFMVFLCSTQSFSQTGKWTQLFPPNSPPERAANGMAYLRDDKILVFGGWKLDDKAYDDTWVYDLSENEWTEVKCEIHPQPREEPAMVHISDSKVLLFGGDLGWDNGYANDTWLFDLDSLKWFELKPLRKPYQRYSSSISYLGNNKVLLYAGYGCPYSYTKTGDHWCDDTWIFDLEKCEWDSLFHGYPQGRDGAQMCELNETDLLLYSGWNGSPTTSNIYIYSSIKNKWKLLEPKVKNLKRVSSTMIQLAENISMVYGGDAQGNLGSPTNTKYADDTWIFNYVDTTWIELKLENKPQGRYYHQMSKVVNGKAILFGGAGNGSLLNDTWLFEFDPTGVKDSTNVSLAQVKVINIKNDVFQIQMNNITEGNINIQLYNINGDVLKNFYSDFNFQNELKVEFNTNELSSGSYFLVIETKQANYYKQILVVH